MSTARYTEGALLIWVGEAGKQSRSKHRGIWVIEGHLDQKTKTSQVSQHHQSLLG